MLKTFTLRHIKVYVSGYNRACGAVLKVGGGGGGGGNPPLLKHSWRRGAGGLWGCGL